MSRKTIGCVALSLVFALPALGEGPDKNRQGPFKRLDQRSEEELQKELLNVPDINLPGAEPDPARSPEAVFTADVQGERRAQESYEKAGFPRRLMPLAPSPE